MLTRGCRAARGRARTVYLIAAAVVGGALLMPALYGRRAERVYRNSLAELGTAGHPFRLQSYRRGWFSSRAVVSLSGGAGATSFVQHIHHGPLGFYDGWHPAFPVAAIVDTDPPPALQGALDRIFGGAPILISTVVGMNGGLDTYISRAPSERADSANNFNARFSGFRLLIHLSRDAYSVSGGAPAIGASGAFGAAEMAGLTIRGQSRRQAQSALWLGGGALDLSRAGYVVAGSATRTASGGLVQDLELSTLTEIKGGRFAAREAISLGSLAVGPLKLEATRLTAGIDNVAPRVVAEFSRDAAAISRAPLDPQTRARMLRRRMIDALAAIVRESPVASLDLRLSSADGEAAGKAVFALSPALANDPLIKDGALDDRGTLAELWSKYGSANAELVAPVALIARLGKPEQLSKLEQGRIVVRNGANYVCRATFKNGGWLINGRKVELPAPPSGRAASGG